MTEQVVGVGWSLPGYRVGPVIGRGAFAVVHRAHQDSLDRDVALKVLTRDLSAEGDRRRFDREREALVRLSAHPHVVDILDAGVTPEGRPFVVMRLYDGGTLWDVVKREGPLPVDRVVAVVSCIASALDAAHAAGVLHRDVKPSNILLTESGEPVLADFGIASLADVAEATSTTFFTPAHVAPEVLERREFSVASDVYALASTAYHLLAGRPAFDPDDPRIATAILDTPPPPLLRPDVPPGVEDAVLAAMAKDPGLRPAGAGDFARALTAAVEAADDGDATDGVPPVAWSVSEPPPVGPAFTAAAPADPPAAAPPPVEASPRRPDGSGGRRRRRALAVLLAVATVAGLVAGWTLLGPDGRDSTVPLAGASSEPAAGTAPSSPVAGTSPATLPTTGTPPPTTSPTSTPSAATSPAAGTRPTAATTKARTTSATTRPATAKPTTTPSVKPTATKPPAAGHLVGSPRSIDLGSGAEGTRSDSGFRLTNDGGTTVTFTTGIMGGGFGAGPSRGTLKPGETFIIDVWIDRTGLAAGDAGGVVVVTCVETSEQFGVQLSAVVT